MENPTPSSEKAALLARDLFSLAEPWRERFLAYIAKQANGWFWAGEPPTREEVTTWLNRGGLYEATTMLLETWQGTQQELHN